ncbi:MAG: DsrE family protein [Pseudomonadota bacterium]|nr:DsrE family protein [Pseudomonadota bacterium]
MRFTLLVNAAADSAAALTALHTARALHDHPEHQLYRLFFYRDAVHLADRHAWRGDGEQACAAQQWQQWLSQTPVDAVVCVGAAQRRGVVADTVADAFSLAGLGQWADALMSSDRVIQFG